MVVQGCCCRISKIYQNLRDSAQNFSARAISLARRVWSCFKEVFKEIKLQVVAFFSCLAGIVMGLIGFKWAVTLVVLVAGVAFAIKLYNKWKEHAIDHRVTPQNSPKTKTD